MCEESSDQPDGEVNGEGQRVNRTKDQSPDQVSSIRSIRTSNKTQNVIFWQA